MTVSVGKSKSGANHFEIPSNRYHYDHRHCRHPFGRRRCLQHGCASGRLRERELPAGCLSPNRSVASRAGSLQQASLPAMQRRRQLRRQATVATTIIIVGLVCFCCGASVGFCFRRLLRFAGMILVVVAAALLLSSAAGASECLPSVKAARAIHHTGHIAWSGGCYFAGYPGRRHRHDSQVRHAKAPVPKERPAFASDARVQTAWGIHSRGMAETLPAQTAPAALTPQGRINEAFAAVGMRR